MPRFVSRFAAGADGRAFSGVWRVWCARHQPDLFIGIRGVGQIKATVHCPRETKPTWKRHFGFDADAKGVVAEAAIADGGRHKVTWEGAQLGPECTLEWRVYILGTALRSAPIEADESVALLRPPEPNQCLIVAIILGPAMETAGFPKAKDAETYLLAEERLPDGRRVWITYCYVARESLVLPKVENPHPRFHGSKRDIFDGPAELRAFAVANNDDGSLGLFDCRVEVRPRASAVGS